MNIEWTLRELDDFLSLTELYRPPDPPGITNFTSHRSNRGGDADIIESAEVVERIFARVLPDWRSTVDNSRNRKVNRWVQHRETARRVRVAIVREDEIAEALGDGAPALSASSLHTWVWEGARSLWQSGHFRDAVGAAARKVNAETQNKTGRRDIAETDLFKQAFSLDPPKTGAPRLRVMADDGGKTYKSVHRGLMAYAEGWYAALRNPAAHLEGELEEAQALEQLAALSVLARHVDSAEVVFAG